MFEPITALFAVSAMVPMAIDIDPNDSGLLGMGQVCTIVGVVTIGLIGLSPDEGVAQR
ncbi:hypothetical protein MF406_13915 [Georgenia sp. TF02-10]|uniref:hypothetical protein n=1 Tax=Georgenia sp. TF02-10 TaxID=2917725 RepID=UPI001FA7D97A|nr:hypothetical protein [Georgenia sp. TF02-10]UNX56545.1 hypothetical protein MF406_13915 [Georgenia sp. TF02-10]